MKDMLHTGEIARILGVDRGTVKRWCEMGKGPRCVRTPGGSRRKGNYLCKREDVEKWLKSLEQPQEIREDTDK